MLNVINKKSIMILSVIFMASVAKAGPLICIQDGYGLFVPSETCQRDCPGKCVPTKQITKNGNELFSSCQVDLVEFDGKTYRVGYGCSGSNIKELIQSIEKQYPELPMKSLSFGF